MKQIFIDASLVMVNERGEIVDSVFYNKTESDCSSVDHKRYDGDGRIEGYDEIISVNLATIPQGVHYMCLLINSING